MMIIEKEHKQSALMSRTKKQLVEHIMYIEHNNNALNETINQQYINCMNLLNNKWIPCSKRLPKGNGLVCLVTVLLEENKVVCDLGWYTEKSYHNVGIKSIWSTTNDWNNGQECKVIAWMPLPEPYKECEKNE